ncbi:basement membrane-specific heparan sulfate proteoglycan core protein-like [Hoplias malabaricus]|uniref:basement membrane-specific heparan sulfate proteoglycan core protein-like n=1 Tax=Hoplias malabaricus TaxID=27720 RepID=UPI003462F050
MSSVSLSAAVLVVLFHRGQTQEYKPRLKVQPEDPVFTGDKVTLSCEPPYSTGWEFHWYKISRNLQHLLNHENRRINRVSVTVSTPGEKKFQCAVHRPDDSPYYSSDIVQVTVRERPTPTVKVQPAQSVFIGERVTLTCDTQSGDYQNYEWYKSNGPHPSSQRKEYVISSVAQTHKGDYTCKGKGSSDRIYTHTSAPLTLTLSERPTPTVKVQPAQSVFIGERVTLTCDTQSGDYRDYEWYQSNGPHPSSQRKEYVISSIAQTNKGDYTCKGKGSSDRIYTHTSAPLTLTLSVKPQPTLTSNRNGSVLRGNPVTLYCTLGQSAGWTFYWSRDTQSPEINSSSSIYTISSVSDSNGGQYRCRAGRGNPVYYTHYSDALWVNVTDNPTAVVSSIKPDVHVSKGESVTLRCDIEAGGDTEWNYIWFKDNNELKQFSRSQEITVCSVTESNSGKYTCRGERKSDSQKSEISDAVTLTVSGEAQAVLSVSPQSWLTEGDSVTLSCEVNISSQGWMFSWYRAVPYRQGLTQITDVHGKVVYSVELLSDSRRGAGGSYTLSPAALYHTGVYVCGAERGEPAFHTQYSSPQPLWITGNSPPVSLIISPSRTQHFSTDSLSLSCEGHRDSAGWRVRRYTHSGNVSNCSSVPGFTCNISSLSTSDTGVYWCQSESGESSDPVNITVHNGAVILESPVHSVSEGDSLTLRCLNRSTNSSHLPADFYKDGELLQNQTTGEMTIHKVSKSHESLYHCKHPEEGESPQSWISVRSLLLFNLYFSVLRVLSSLMAVTPYLIITIVLGVKCHRGTADHEYKPKLKVQPQDAVFTGDTVTLSCEPPDYTGWEFYWNTNSQNLQPLLIPENRRSRVSVTLSTPGVTKFQCAVGRPGDNPYYFSDTVQVTVRETPTPTVKIQPDLSVFIGETVTLTCEIHSEDSWSYYWFKGDTQQSQHSKTYHIPTVDGNHGGAYSCRGGLSGRINTHTSASVTLTVSVKPQPTLTSSRNGSVLRGNPVTLYCTLGQSAGWTFYWSRDTQSPEIRTSSSIYTISSVSDSNGGQYRCRAGRGHPVYYTHYSDALWVNVTASSTAVLSSIKPDVHVFKGENVTLRCDIEAGGDTEWNYIWFKDNNELKQFSRSQEITVRSVTESNSGKYTCRGERKSDSQKSEISDAVTLTVSGEAQAVLSVSPQSWLTKGDSVTLSCEVNISSKGWTFSWYRAVPYRQGLTQITDVHGKVVYSVELLSDSRRGAGGSYTLSPAALYHTGVYVCGAERGEPAFHTQYSSPQPLWITGEELEPVKNIQSEQSHYTSVDFYSNSPPVSLIISPSRTQHFSTDSVNGAVILESPVHSVSEGDSLTLRCLYRSTKSSHLPADFYKDGVLLQKQTTREMTIDKVSKSHEGLYHCKNPEKGESPRSWISVRRSGLDGVITGVAVGLSVSLLLIIILGLFCYYKKNKGKTTADDDTIYSDVKHTTD